MRTLNQFPINLEIKDKDVMLVLHTDSGMHYTLHGMNGFNLAWHFIDKFNSTDYDDPILISMQFNTDSATVGLTQKGHSISEDILTIRRPVTFHIYQLYR